MNYQEWNDLIYEYYFGRQVDKKVVFHITIQDLVDFAKEKNVQIAQNIYASNCDDDFIKRDFVSKFWLNRNPRNTNIGNAGMTEFQKRLLELKEGAMRDDCKQLLAVVSVLIMPICENDNLDLHANDYYGHLSNFLRDNGFVNRLDDSKELLSGIGLDQIWRCINNWAEENDLPFKSYDVVDENGRHRYVQSLMNESLLSPACLQRFCILFENGGLAPKVNIEDDRLLSVFKQYHEQIGLSDSKYRQLVSDDYSEYLVSVLRQEYCNWDGTTRIRVRNRETGNIKMEAGDTYYPLLLQMEYNVHSAAPKFGFQLYCSDIDDMEYMNFKPDDLEQDLPAVYVRSDGFANRPFCFEEAIVNDIFDKGVFSIYEKDVNSIKARFVVTDYYVLKVYKNKYVATNEFAKGEFYFVILRNSSIDSFSNWLKGNNAKCILENILGNKYCLYKIECAAVEMPQRYNLRFKSEVRCKSANNIEVKTADQSDVVLLSKFFDAQFEITGVDVTNDSIYAVSVNCETLNSTELTYNHDKGLWVLKASANTDQEFQLYYNESPIPYGRTYRFSDFVLPSDFKEIVLDKWGGISGDEFTSGLTLPKQVIEANLINWDIQQKHMGQAPSKDIKKGQYKETDYLLYAITSASYKTDQWIIKMSWLKSLKDRIALECVQEDNRFALQNALADYFRMGYVNYVYTDKGLCITANRPTLVLLSPDYQRDIYPNRFGNPTIQVKCMEKLYKCMLSGGRTISLINSIIENQSALNYKMEIIEEEDPLMPQTIFIYAKERSTFVKLAQKLNLVYQDNIYANALLEQLPSVDDYCKYIIEAGMKRDLFNVKHFRVIDYAKMAEIYPEKLQNQNAIANIEINKDNFNKLNDIVTFLPGTKDECSVLICDGKMFEVDKYWGHFIGMKKAEAQVLVHNDNRAQISMPQQLRLPLLYARALTLLTGQTPQASFGSRTYDIGVNPCTYASASHPNTILKKLGQI